MPTYLFRLQQAHVFFQRGKVGDVYSVVFGIEVGSRQVGPIGSVIGDSAHHVVSGANIVFRTLPPVPPPTPYGAWEIGPPDKPPSKWGTWDVGPVAIDDADTVAIDYAFVNTSDYRGLSPGDQTKIGLTTWTSLVGVGLAATGVGALPGAIVAGVGAVLGELIGDLVDSNNPQCNGLAFADKIVLNGAYLRESTDNPDGQMIITRHATNPDIPSDCGHASEADITTAVILIQDESVGEFLGTKGDLSRGMKAALSLSTPVSVRSLIEQ